MQVDVVAGITDLEGRELISLKSEGVPELRRALRQFEPDLVPRLKSNLEGAVETILLPKARSKIAADVHPKKPSRSTGALRASLRAQMSGAGVYIVAGTARVPYYGWRDFGGDLKPKGRRFNTQKRPYIVRGRYLYPSIDESRAALESAVSDAVDLTTRSLELS